MKKEEHDTLVKAFEANDASTVTTDNTEDKCDGSTKAKYVAAVSRQAPRSTGAQSSHKIKTDVAGDVPAKSNLIPGVVDLLPMLRPQQRM